MFSLNVKDPSDWLRLDLLRSVLTSPTHTTYQHFFFLGLLIPSQFMTYHSGEEIKVRSKGFVTVGPNLEVHSVYLSSERDAFY